MHLGKKIPYRKSSILTNRKILFSELHETLSQGAVIFKPGYEGGG